MEIDKMTGNYTGNSDDYTSGGLLESHDDEGNNVGNHAFDFGLQAQCGSNLTLYDQISFNKNGVVLIFFGDPTAKDAEAIFSDLKANIKKFKNRDIGLIAIDASAPAKNMTFAKKMEIEGREIIIFYDRNGIVGQKYDAYNGLGWFNFGNHKTAYYILDKDGVIQYKYVGNMLENQSETLIKEIDK